MAINSRFNVIWIIGQRTAFSKKIIAESNRARQETVEIDILITSRYRHAKKIMESIIVTCGLTARMRERNQFSQFR